MTNGSGRDRTQRDVYSSYRFWVEAKSITQGAFSECSGLSAELELFDWDEGGSNGFKLRLPVRTKYPNLVLKRGIASLELYEWFLNVANGTNLVRKELSIILTGYTGMKELRWEITGALPVKWTGPTLKTGASEAAVETIELIHYGFQRKK